MTASRVNTCLCVDMPLVQYEMALDLQQKLVIARHGKIVKDDVVLLLEHPPVFTLGRRGGLGNLKVSGTFLKRNKIPIIQVERGGDITFHGPGQIVVYPIIDLSEAGFKIMDYVEGLEEIMIRVVLDWGIRAKRNPANRGIWVANKKLGSVGIAVKKWVCFHGFALNVDLPLNPFNWINPCGLQDVCVTSMAQELSQKISMSKVRESIKYHFASVFGFNLVRVKAPYLHHLIKSYATEHFSSNLSRLS